MAETRNDMTPDQVTRIYITHCSRTKAKGYEGTKEAVAPNLLYTSKHIQGFMARCKARGVRWAIFSDLYGVWFPEETHEWYEKDPDTMIEVEFEALLQDFDEKLSPYDEIFFYYNPGRFHALYARLLQRSGLAARVRKITHLWEIV